ncbi:diaminopimelate dehydrogenase [Oscillospiraceae bacterium MB08-C2-2]|nr:diaminopimelate dehydrogenase [Oscillospiraceae bacterium MB08-C2-2]
MKIKAIVVGYGNIGKSVIQALEASPDFELIGIVRRKASSDMPAELLPLVVEDVSQLASKPDVAILCTPTRSAPDMAEKLLKMGIHTVDSYDIHTSILDVKKRLDSVAKEGKAVAIVSAGWDPGSDSVVRTLMEACAPKGLTYTNFGPGMSMGHTVCVKGKEGVKHALSMTIPLGTGIHRRMVYVELEEGYTLEQVTADIKADPYFSHDETHVIQVSDVDALLDMGHGVNMTRKGVSGTTQNQLFEFNMKINNPALTAQVMVGTARAALRQQPGAYTMIEIPVIDLLAGDRDDLIRRLV